MSYKNIIHYIKNNNVKYIVVVIAISFLFLINSVYSSDEEVLITDETKIEEEEVLEEVSLNIYVDIKGEVLSPGVYQIKDDERIIDAITLAGGFSEKANTLCLNLSSKVKDELVIFVPTLNDENNCNLNCEEKEIIPKKGGDNIEQKISINKATLEQLMTIPKIGEAKAQAIIKYRTENDGFESLDELLNISGIGAKIFEEIMSHITL